MQLNEYECEMLDVLLEAFGVPDMLTRRQVMGLFDQDEATAFRMVQILLREELVAEKGDHGDFDLPERLILKPKGDKFLHSGGFTALYHQGEQVEPEVIGTTVSNLQQQSLKLGNQRLLHEREIIALKRKVTVFKILLWLALVLIGAAFVLGYRIGHGK